MSKKQILVAVLGITVLCGAYFVMFIGPIAKLKREHPEIFAINPPNAVVGGLPGMMTLLVILLITGAAIIALSGKR